MRYYEVESELLALLWLRLLSLLGLLGLLGLQRSGIKFTRISKDY
jgi:hypothetical protein